MALYDGHLGTQPTRTILMYPRLTPTCSCHWRRTFTHSFHTHTGVSCPHLKGAYHFTTSCLLLSPRNQESEGQVSHLGPCISYPIKCPGTGIDSHFPQANPYSQIARPRPFCRGGKLRWDPSSLHVMPAIQDPIKSGSRVPGRTSILSPMPLPYPKPYPSINPTMACWKLLLVCSLYMTLPASITLRTGLQPKRGTFSTVAIGPHQSSLAPLV